MEIKPEKPIKAIAMIPAIIRVMGTPFNTPGTSANSRFSLRPAIKTIARVKPTPAAKANITLSIKLYPSDGINKARPNIAQLVVIRGRKIPSALYKAGLVF